MKLRELDHEELRHRLRSTFFDAYLTIVSIVQGAVFAVGAQQTLQMLSSNPSSYTFLIWAVASFLYIATVYYYYYWFLLCFGAFPTYGEIVRPFLLGAIELAAVYHIGDTPRFLIVSSVFFTVAAGIFLYAIRANRPSLYLGSVAEVYRLLRVESIKNMIGTALLAVICASGYFLATRYSFPTPFFELAVFTVMFLVSSVLVWSSEVYFRSRLFSIARRD